jgi:hypothetical protein
MGNRVPCNPAGKGEGESFTHAYPSFSASHPWCKEEREMAANLQKKKRSKLLRVRDALDKERIPRLVRRPISFMRVAEV